MKWEAETAEEIEPIPIPTAKKEKCAKRSSYLVYLAASPWKYFRLEALEASDVDVCNTRKSELRNFSSSVPLFVKP